MAEESKATKRRYVNMMFLNIYSSSITGNTSNVGYQVFFMKKLWSTTVIGKDLTADVMFHFHQVNCRVQLV